MTKFHVWKIVHHEIAIFFDGNGGQTFQLILMITRHSLWEGATMQMRWLQNKFPVLEFGRQSQWKYCSIIHMNGEHSSTMEPSRHQMVRVIKKPKKLFSEIVITFDEIDGISWKEFNSMPSCRWCRKTTMNVIQSQNNFSTLRVVSNLLQDVNEQQLKKLFFLIFSVRYIGVATPWSKKKWNFPNFFKKLKPRWCDVFDDFCIHSDHIDECGWMKKILCKTIQKNSLDDRNKKCLFLPTLECTIPSHETDLKWCKSDRKCQVDWWILLKIQNGSTNEGTSLNHL